MRRSTHRIDGLATPVAETGAEGAAEAVVCVHGNPGHLGDWAGVLDAVAPLARCVAPDMPGFGGADKPDDWPYDVAAYGRHLGLLLDELGVERAHLVLHDFGGPWAFRWAVDHPDRVASYTLINTIAVYRKWHTLARVWRTPVLGEAFMATSSRAGLRAIMGSTDPRLAREHVDAAWARFDAGTRRAILRLYRQTDPVALSDAVRPGLLAHPRPAAIIWGTRDRYLPAAVAELQREVFPDAPITWIDPAGHWPMLEAPVLVEAAVVEHLRTVW